MIANYESTRTFFRSLTSRFRAIQNLNDGDLTNGPGQCTSGCSSRNTVVGFAGEKYNSCFSSAGLVAPAVFAVLIALVGVLML